nr:uncharacterized protein CI109_000144 [Kwoniella shandongensis]KAA5531304.1 hypothetical protein CI109_000144 [Kwoniella shandongensis]
MTSSLLPAEHLTPSESGTWPRTIDISSDDNELSLHVVVQEGYAGREDVTVEIKSAKMGRDEAAGWKDWVCGRMNDWDNDEDYPLYQLLTTHFLPLLAPSSAPSNSPSIPTPTEDPTTTLSSRPHHVLLISHHLLSSTKRKDLISLSSTLSLTGFSKPGHPGIMYAIGTLPDLEEWVREVKSWNWLALRVRAGPEAVEGETVGGKGQENGARGGKGRGEWVELEKISEALEWLRNRGGKERERLLIDVGVGGGK